MSATEAPPPSATLPRRLRLKIPWVRPLAGWRGGARWFGAELLVVVAGVLIALAIQAWHQARQDAGRARAYLGQIAADLRETERRILEADSLNAESESFQVLLVGMYHRAEPPPRDSVAQWIRVSNGYLTTAPVLGTVEALIATGDLRLIRDDSLRAAIVAYLGTMRDEERSLVSHGEHHLNHLYRLLRHVDIAEVVPLAVPPAVFDSLARANPAAPHYTGQGEHDPFPFRVEALLSDREAYAVLMAMGRAKQSMRYFRQRMLAPTCSLRAQVEAMLAR